MFWTPSSKWFPDNDWILSQPLSWRRFRLRYRKELWQTRGTNQRSNRVGNGERNQGAGSIILFSIWMRVSIALKSKTFYTKRVSDTASILRMFPLTLA